MLDLFRFLENVSEPAAMLGPDGQAVPLPIEAYEVLLKAVASMRAGKAIMIAPLDQRLTTQKAANFLGISRPTLVKLLEQGEISYERPAAGRHRRVRLNDVLDYQRRKRTDRRATLDELTEQAADFGSTTQIPTTPRLSKLLASAALVGHAPVQCVRRWVRHREGRHVPIVATPHVRVVTKSTLRALQETTTLV